MFRRAGCLLLLLFFFSAFQNLSAGILDPLSPAKAGIRAAARDLKEEATRLGEPYGLFGTYWLMLPEELREICVSCEVHPKEPRAYRELRTVRGINCTVVYEFSELPKSRQNVLDQINVIPLTRHQDYNQLQNEYLVLRKYLLENGFPLSDIRYQYDKSGKVAGAESSATFRHSKLVHKLITQQGRAGHMIFFFKTK